MQTVLLSIFIALTCSAIDSKTVAQIEHTSATIKEVLEIPYGTIVEIKAKVVNGDDLESKAYMGTYLLKVLEINGKRVKNVPLLHFEDETGAVPQDNFQLYKYLNGEEANGLTSEEIADLQKQFIGKKLNLMVYESGMFTGAPNGYFDYQPIKSTTGFYFKHYLVVVQRK